MSHSAIRAFRQHTRRLTRRDFFKSGSLLASLALIPRQAAPLKITPEPPSGALRIGPDIYQSIGVRPFINGTGTLTVNGGSLELPEVRAAMDAAAQHMVQLDELMEGVGKRLAELTGAEWGIVTAGCAAAMTLATLACVAGGNPDKHIRLPSMEGLGKDEVIIPKHSRNNYDAAIRAVGVRLIEVTNAQELEAAIGPRTAMIYIFAGPQADAGPPSYEEIIRIARQKNIPVLTDAAAEILTIPNVHLQRGSTMVAYSGGKQLRGPQCSGLLLGRKDLVTAAWVHSAPHHGFARNMKVGKEEIIGVLAAVEVWVKRDNKAIWQQMLDQMNYIAKKVSSISGITSEVREPTGLSNRSPGLNIRWEAAKLGMTGRQVTQILDTTEPRILLGGSRGGQNGISITAFNLKPGDEKVIADRLYTILSAPPNLKSQESPKAPVADLTGVWDVHIEFRAGTGEHSLSLQQRGSRIQGIHRGEFVARDLTGTIDGDAVQLHSSLPERAIGNALSFTFTGKVEDETMSGELDMGEYLKARWSAKRHRYGL
ncbi:MAG: aminotransferase class V-fold PLP-dependent enzyme [Acidobacteria bacterium]|nr:aminotransferase class V-fold PLP-dependent enzyme [Acidobacteriota bacterium]